MAASSGSSSYYGDMSNEFYCSGFDDCQNDIDQSLDFGHGPSTDFYLRPEMFLTPQMFGEQPYPSQHIFTGMTPIHDHLPSQPSCGEPSNNRTSSPTQLSSRAPDGNLRQTPAEVRIIPEDQQNDYAVGENYYGHGNDENLDRPRKKQRSEDKKIRTSNIPQANVFRLDLRIPSILQAESQLIASQESLSSVFEVNVNQQPKRKARSAFTPQGKKKVEAVRSVGACIQCKFRKRTCETSEPCMLCIRRTGNVESAATLCTRESPFIELSITEFYSKNYPKCVTDFDVDFSGVEGQHKAMKVDGKGPTSSPLILKVIEVQCSSLSEDIIKEVYRVNRTNPSFSSQQITGWHHTGVITVLDLECFSSTQLEEWVVKYTYDNKLDYVNSTPFLFGVAYAKERLPHADLVENITKLIALNYMLCNGLKILSLDGQQEMATQHPALRAQLDTKLFNLLYNAEKLAYQEIQRLVFKTSGQLPKDALVPVSLVLWLLTRLHSLKASYLINLTEASSGTSKSSASDQEPTLNLLISVLTALFRSSFPLLINFEEKCNRELLGGNEDLIQLSKKLKRDLIAFKRRGYLKDWKWNKGFLKEQVDRLRDVLTE